MKTNKGTLNMVTLLIVKALTIIGLLLVGAFLLMHQHPVAGGWLMAAAIIVALSLT